MPRKKNRSIPEPAPLKLVRDFEKAHSGVWDICEMLRDALTQNGFFWDSRCYIPSAPCVEFVHMDGWCDSGIEESAAATWMYTLASWRRYKEIYSFDGDFADILMMSATDEVIPSNFLNSLPYPSFYVSIDGKNDLDVDGFFCCIDCYFESQDDCRPTLTIVANSNSGVVAIPIIIQDGMTLKDSMDRIKSWGLERGEDFDYDEAIDHSKVFAEKALQLILYICATNADIEENVTQKSIRRKSADATKPKDVLREIRKWDVGYRIGSIVRKSKQNPDSQDSDENHKTTKSKKSSSKRPHSRRGHFHHFWIGSEKDGTRRLVLKWVAPMFINAQYEEITATINMIDNQV